MLEYPSPMRKWLHSSRNDFFSTLEMLMCSFNAIAIPPLRQPCLSCCSKLHQTHTEMLTDIVQCRMASTLLGLMVLAHTLKLLAAAKYTGVRLLLAEQRLAHASRHMLSATRQCQMLFAQVLLVTYIVMTDRLDSGFMMCSDTYIAHLQELKCVVATMQPCLELHCNLW